MMMMMFKPLVPYLFGKQLVYLKMYWSSASLIFILKTTFNKYVIN